MRKLVLSVVIILGMGFSASAQYFNNDESNQRPGGGLFGFGAVSDEMFYGAGDVNDKSLLPILPVHDQDDDQDAPIGSGALLLIGMGAAYVMTKKNK